ncbi:hypothetical protein VNO77_47096 [Canavalia gladiata]|uniref:Uncharacterized protein n=1 Tax=Canavalia gladiata TaxID=3824 RepID=A0AAN9PEJ9_CANGL
MILYCCRILGQALYLLSVSSVLVTIFACKGKVSSSSISLSVTESNVSVAVTSSGAFLPCFVRAGKSYFPSQRGDTIRYERKSQLRQEGGEESTRRRSSVEIVLFRKPKLWNRISVSFGYYVPTGEQEQEEQSFRHEVKFSTVTLVRGLAIVFLSLWSLKSLRLAIPFALSGELLQSQDVMLTKRTTLSLFYLLLSVPAFFFLAIDVDSTANGIKEKLALEEVGASHSSALSLAKDNFLTADSQAAYSRTERPFSLTPVLRLPVVSALTGKTSFKMGILVPSLMSRLSLNNPFLKKTDSLTTQPKS